MPERDSTAASYQGKWRAILLLTAAEVLALGLWFSVSAVIPALGQQVGISDFQASLFSSAVAVGFVAGTLTSAILGLADRLEPRRFFMMSSLVAAAANGLIVFLDPESTTVIVLRFVTGACMAGIYPVGMKIAASWARNDTGLLVGLLVGALTLGSASPHLFSALGGIDWQITLLATSASAVLAGILATAIQLGPNVAGSSAFRPALVWEAWRNKAVRLANFGYFGHMWELYAMWGWIGVFLHKSFEISYPADTDKAAFLAGLVTFAVIGVGGLGSLFAGLLADRIGRTTVTIGAMAVSGACAIAVGPLFGGSVAALTIVCLLWGLTVIADSAQFSSCIIELTEPSTIGTMLTTQTCLGFLLTLLTLHMIPFLVTWVGWSNVFAVLAIGSFLGIIAMVRLRRHPDAIKIAGGRR